jgi:hypothetical protein
LAGAAGENDVGYPDLAAQGGQGDVLVVLAGQGKVGHLAQHGQGLGFEGKDDKRGQKGEHGDEQAAPDDPFHFAFGQVPSPIRSRRRRRAGFGFLGDPFVIIRLGDDFDGPSHGVMAHAAKLGAVDLVGAQFLAGVKWAG